MKPVKQKYKHNPDTKVHGDCWAACISSITEISLNELPDVNDFNFEDGWPDFYMEMIIFLEDKGFELAHITVDKFNGNGDDVIASGKSPRGDFNHAVVWNNGIVHDPHPDNTGIHSIHLFEIIEKIK